MLIVAIDGACRRNGSPTCVSASGVYLQEVDQYLAVKHTSMLANYEAHSTNQRGELLALLTALKRISAIHQDAQIVTDSEYLFNAMTHEWYNNWLRNGWKTSTGGPVKNADLWERVAAVYEACKADKLDINLYHIKGHCITFGKVTANTLLAKDESGRALQLALEAKYDTVFNTSKKDALDHAQEVSIKNNGFKLPPETLKSFVVANMMADAIATKCVDAADALID